MALSPKISVCFRDNCKTIRVEDTTGVYNASTNTGGWGVPNTTLALASPVILTMTLPSGTEEEFTLTATVNAATIIDGKFLLDDITPSDVTGLTDVQFPDGVYTFEYVVTDSSTGTKYTYLIKGFNTCKVKCCIDKMLTKFCENLCNCNDVDHLDRHNMAEALLFAAKCEFGKGQYTKATSILEDVEKICKAVNCSC